MDVIVTILALAAVFAFVTFFIIAKDDREGGSNTNPGGSDGREPDFPTDDPQ